MEKGKAWLKDKIKDEEYNLKYVYDNFVPYEKVLITDDVYDLIDQLDEPEVTLDKALEKVAESYLMTKEEIWRHLERLETHGGKVTYDELEVLSQEWIESNSVYASSDGVTEEYIHVDDLKELLVPKHQTVEVQKLISKYSIDTMSTYDVKVEREGFVKDLQNLLVPKQDKPVIPQFVADWIEKWKREELILRDWSRFNLDDENEYEVAEWLYDNDDDEINILRKFTLIDAIRYGYEVEKEPHYHVAFRGESNLLYVTHVDIYGENGKFNYTAEYHKDHALKFADESKAEYLANLIGAIVV